ncbi:MAG TPA: glycosyltransferase [Candidatus Saccharimonadales bacterium]
MKKGVVSIIIPSRADRYLQRTVDDLLQKAQGEIEIIIVFDGFWPEPMIKDNPRVIIVYHGQLHSNFGMRESINRGVAISQGEYIMKLDEHCALDEGFDKVLTEDCEDNWVVMPRLYELNAETWQPFEGTAIDNTSFRYPSLNLYKWRSWHRHRRHILIDDCMCLPGSCYFMPRKHWDQLGGLDSTKYGKFHYEAQEICLKTWLGGGRVVTNKKTWYAHRHRRAKDYSFSSNQYREHNESKTEISRFLEDYWINNRWEGRTRDFEWLIDRFWPVPYWPENWREEIYGAKEAIKT